MGDSYHAYHIINMADLCKLTYPKAYQEVSDKASGSLKKINWVVKFLSNRILYVVNFRFHLVPPKVHSLLREIRLYVYP